MQNILWDPRLREDDKLPIIFWLSSKVRLTVQEILIIERIIYYKDKI